MKQLLFYVFIFLFTSVSFAQGEANYWYFGDYAGLNFGTTPPTALTDGELSTLEGCTTISDSGGNLLFYTDGSNIWNKNHEFMQNGTGLKGDESSTTSALIVPKPNSENIFYVFTVDEPHHLNADDEEETSANDGVNNGFMYSIVDMNLNNGLGGVIPESKNTQLPTYDSTIPLQSAYKCSEKITAVKGSDCSSIWVITHFVDSFYSFRIDENGINPYPVISNVGVTVPLEGYRRNSLGYMKASPEGDKLAVAHLGLTTQMGADGPGKVLIYDFNNTTGVVSNELELYNGDSPYGIEFSASGNRLFASIGIGNAGNSESFLLQYDMTVPEDSIANSMFYVPNEVGDTISYHHAGALQLGPDEKIYRALFSFYSDSNDYLGLIKNPEALGPELEYTESEVFLNVDGNRGSQIGLPPFIQSIFAEKIDITNLSEDEIIKNLNLCDSEVFQLSYEEIENATYTWYLNDEMLPGENSHELQAAQPPGVTLPYNQSYRLEVALNDGSCPFIGYANITYHPIPEDIATMPDEYLCYPEDAANLLFNFSEKRNEILATQIADAFQVRFFENEENAINAVNPLPNSYEIQNYSTQIFARIESVGNSNCFILENFNIYAAEAPMIATPEPIALCENQDGSNLVLDLPAYAQELLQNSNEHLFNTEYFPSYEDAENETNPIAQPENFELSQSSDTLFFKFENISEPNCFEVVEVPVQVLSIPEVNNSSLTQCSVENGGPTSYFDLTKAQDSITEVTNVEFHYYTTLADAQANVNEISNIESYQNVTNPQTLFVQVKNETNDCYALAELELNLVLTDANDATLVACDNDGNNDGLSTFTLNDAEEQILSGLPEGLEIEFYETEENALLEIDPLPNNYENTTAHHQEIYARVSHASACYAVNKLSLFVHELPPLPPDQDIYYCQDQFPQTITLDAGISEATNSYEFSWTPTSETTSSIEVNETGTYTVTATNPETGCSTSRTFNVLPINAAIVDHVNVQGVDYNNSIEIILTSENIDAYEFALDDPSGSYQAENIFYNVAPGLHHVYIRNTNGNCAMTSIAVSVVGFPKFFTPNNDGFNDYWQVIGADHELVSDIFIFDRFGKLLAKLDPASTGWNGFYNDKRMPPTDYWYKVKLQDGRVYRGHFSLKR